MILDVPRLLVFDLDGTLIDSRTDLTHSVNAMLEHFGEPALAQETIGGYIGDGAEALVRRALTHAHRVAALPDPHDDALVFEALQWFLAYYREHKLDYTYVYPGVMETLGQIRAAHPRLAMAVLTNKPVGPSRAICEHFGLDRLMFQNYGGDSFGSKKPDAEGLLQLVEEASAWVGDTVLASETVMIGDSHVDIETAKNAGAMSVGCLYGLSPETVVDAGADALVRRPEEWIVALGL